VIPDSDSKQLNIKLTQRAFQLKFTIKNEKTKEGKLRKRSRKDTKVKE